MKKTRCTILILLVAMFLLSGHAIAKKGGTSPSEFRLANVFNSKMVMQCDKEVTVWGWARPGASVTVTISEDAKLIAPHRDEKEAPLDVTPPPITCHDGSVDGDGPPIARALSAWCPEGR